MTLGGARRSRGLAYATGHTRSTGLISINPAHSKGRHGFCGGDFAIDLSKAEKLSLLGRLCVLRFLDFLECFFYEEFVAAFVEGLDFDHVA